MVVKLSCGSVVSGTLTSSADALPCLWLSVLIPAYEHPAGVLRILDRLHAARVKGVECRINDDSQSDAVQTAVWHHPLYRAGDVIYRRNRPALGAVPNWNDLLAQARGLYLLLMHHDECPERDDFFIDLQAALVQVDSPDVLLLDCLLPTLGGLRLRHHMPLWIRRGLLAWNPDHLLRHNTLGPPSVVVARRSVYVSFDPALKWLVDVDWMVRLLRNTGVSWSFSKRLAVVSSPHASTSITASLINEIPRLREEEALRIRRRLGPSLIFCLLLPDTLLMHILTYVESGIWLVARALIRSTGWLTGRPRSAWLRKRN